MTSLFNPTKNKYFSDGSSSMHCLQLAVQYSALSCLLVWVVRQLSAGFFTFRNAVPSRMPV